MQQLLHPICLTLAIAGFLLLLWPPRYLRQDRALAALVGVYGFTALSFLAALEWVWGVLGDATGRPSIGILVAFGSVTAQVALQPVVLAYWALPPAKAQKRARLCLAAGAMAIAALTALFFQLPSMGRTTPQSVTATYIHTSFYQAYLALYITVYAVGQTALVVGCWSAARRTDQIWVARGLRIVGAGALLTFGYSAVRLAYVGAAVVGVRAPSPAFEHFAWLCADGGNTLTLIGFFVPTLAVHVVPQLRIWARARRDHKSLAPLWGAIYRALPALALHFPGTTDAARLRIWDASWHLYRRAVEIRDGQWALRHYLEESVRSTATERHRMAGLTGTELASAVTADQLHAALAAYLRNERPQIPTEYADAAIREDARTPDDDVRALLCIAAHFDTSHAPQKVATSWT